VAQGPDRRAQRQLAEPSATLLPSHPRIKQLSSELADVRVQIRAEANKIVKSLEHEAVVAAARETSLRNSLTEVQTQASGMSDAEVKLRALEREAKAQRHLLESYLARFRDASARHDIGAVPAQATIVSRAHASIKPSFPKRGPMGLLIAAANSLICWRTSKAPGDCRCDSPSASEHNTMSPTVVTDRAAECREDPVVEHDIAEPEAAGVSPSSKAILR
jgi:hypothetical protein